MKITTSLSITVFTSIALLCSCNQSSKESNESLNDTVVAIVDSITSVNSESETGPTDVNNTARFIAGIAQDNENEFKNLENNTYWVNYSSNLNKRFKTLDSTRYSKMRTWRDLELKEINTSTEKLFYPFSGPDFLNAYTFFPHAKEYTLLALEPPGKLPSANEISQDTSHVYFNSVENGLKAILSFSFFRTEAMEKDFASKELNGTVHLISLFAARTGNKIVSVVPANIDSLGNIVQREKCDCEVRGFQMKFEDAVTHELKTLNYFSLDVSDEALAKNKCFRNYVSSIEGVTTYLKSASYLMHLWNFSFIRNTILNRSQYVLQDDSGIPLKFFRDTTWNKTFYGTYDKPISLFKNKFQETVFKTYNDSVSKLSVRKLPFGIGYDYKPNESNLMLFRKKN
jgi:hypothetical protein